MLETFGEDYVLTGAGQGDCRRGGWSGSTPFPQRAAPRWSGLVALDLGYIVGGGGC